jgi:hypothetical protein
MIYVDRKPTDVSPGKIRVTTCQSGERHGEQPVTSEAGQNTTPAYRADQAYRRRSGTLRIERREGCLSMHFAPALPSFIECR